MVGPARGKTQPRVYAAIREMAIRYELAPGETVNEAGLAAKLRVSRTPVREALNRLVTERLMTFVPNKGFFCRTLSPEEICNLFEVRECLEVTGFCLACERASDTEIAALDAAWSEVLRTAARLSPQDWARHDEAFHEDLVGLAANPELTATLKGINARIRFIREIENQRTQRTEAMNQEHSAILRALQAREVKFGAQALHRHLAMTRSDAIEAIKEALARAYLARSA